MKTKRNFYIITIVFIALLILYNSDFFIEDVKLNKSLGVIKAIIYFIGALVIAIGVDETITKIKNRNKIKLS